MARGKRGRPVHGWLIVDKPAGVTSAAVVAKAKWALGADKAGHAGTLDPAATGLLALAFGEATKTVPFVPTGARPIASPCAGARRRRRTTPRARWSPPPTRGRTAAAIEAALPAFSGEIMQVPPQVSAVKVAGERAYDLARAGETLDLAARPLTVERLELVEAPDRGHGGLRDGLRQGRLRAQHRPRPRRAPRLPRARRRAPAAVVGAVRPRRRGRLGDARGRGEDAGARRAAAAGAGGARGAAGDRLSPSMPPGGSSTATPWRCRRRPASPRARRSGRAGAGGRSPSARGGRGRCIRAASSCSADGRLAPDCAGGRRVARRVTARRRAAGARPHPRRRRLQLGLRPARRRGARGRGDELRHRDPPRPAQPRRPLGPARAGVGRGGGARRDRAREHGDPRRDHPRLGRLPVARRQAAVGGAGAGLGRGRDRVQHAVQARLRPAAARPRAARDRGLYRELPLGARDDGGGHLPDARGDAGAGAADAGAQGLSLRARGADHRAGRGRAGSISGCTGRPTSSPGWTAGAAWALACWLAVWWLEARRGP